LPGTDASEPPGSRSAYAPRERPGVRIRRVDDVTVQWLDIRRTVVNRLRRWHAVDKSAGRLRQLLDRWDGVVPVPLPATTVEQDYDRVLSSIDHPLPGEVIGRQVRVDGWVAWDDEPAAAVTVHVAGMLLGRALLGGVDRPDVAEALGVPALIGSGWSVDIDLLPFVGRPITLEVFVWPGGDAPSVLLGTVPVEVRAKSVGPAAPGGIVRARIDVPAEGGVVGPYAMHVVGQVGDEWDPVASLDVVVNGRHTGRARLGLDRNGPRIGDGRTEVALTGFEHIVDLDVLPPSESVLCLQLVARTLGGPPTVVADRIVRRAPAEVGDEIPVGPESSPHRQAGLSESGLDLVVFTHDLGYGGGQLWLSELLRRSGAGRRFPCTVIAPVDGPQRSALERDGVVVRVTQPFPIDTLSSYEGRVDELSQVVTSRGYNAALVNTLGSFMAADVTRRLGIPTVWAVHESVPAATYLTYAFGSRVIPPGIRRRFFEALRDTPAVVFEAEATRLLFQDSVGPGHSLVVPYGVDTAALDTYAGSVDRIEARSRLGIDPLRRVALVMGTIEPRKAQTRIAQAFERVAESHPEWDLVFVGDTGSDYGRALKSHVAGSAWAHRVRVEPVVPDTAPWYRAADVLVSASDIESLPRSALESMCLGVPVLATAIFGLPELIIDGGNGFLVEPGDLHALIAALHRVFATTPEELVAVGGAASRLIHAEYDSAGYATTIMALLDRLRSEPDLRVADFLAGTEQPVVRA